jgi:anaerobic C4-dicarboxylate transporter-like protein
MIWVELVVFLACIVVGARLGGMALGSVAGVGLAVFVFVFGMPPGGPPGVVVGMIIAVITAVAALQAAGGLDYLVTVAERILRRKPKYITFLAPVVTYVLVFASGTTHVIYALLPIISEVSRQSNIRPERPLSISVIAGFQGVRASPISAATVAMLGFLAVKGVSLTYLLAITIPSTFLAVLVGALSVAWRGRSLDEDPECQKRVASGTVKPPEAIQAPEGRALFNARGATLLFLAGITAVVVIGLFPALRPEYEVATSGGIETDQVAMSAAIMIVMFALSGLMTMLFDASPQAALKGSIMRGGITAIISIIGVSWLGSSFFEGNRSLIIGGISDLVRVYPWTFAVGLFLLSFLLFSAAAAVSILVPVGVALGLPAWELVVFYPAAAGNFFLPTYGTLLAAVSFDQTGTTRIGKYLLNHSFMRPGLVTMAAAILIAWALSSMIPL